MLDGRRALIALLTGALLGVAGFGIAIAQDGDGSDPGVEDDSSDGAPSGELGGRVRAQLTPEQQMEEANSIEERGTQLSRRLLAMLDEARRERDIIRVTCLSDKLTQVNAHLRTLSNRKRRMEEATQTGDSARRNHEFTVISVIGQSFRTLEQEANSCTQQDLYETGTTTITTDIDPDTPEEDPHYPGARRSGSPVYPTSGDANDVETSPAVVLRVYPSDGSESANALTVGQEILLGTAPKT